MENRMVCNCMKVSYFDIIDTLHHHERFEDVQKAFEVLQKITKCSTGCGGCHDKILDLVSQLMMGAQAENN